MDEQERADKKQSIDQLIEQFHELDRKASSDLEKLAAIQREFRSLSDHDIPIADADSKASKNDKTSK